MKLRPSSRFSSTLRESDIAEKMIRFHVAKSLSDAVTNMKPGECWSLNSVYPKCHLGLMQSERNGQRWWLYRGFTKINGKGFSRQSRIAKYEDMDVKTALKAAREAHGTWLSKVKADAGKAYFPDSFVPRRTELILDEDLSREIARRGGAKFVVSVIKKEINSEKKAEFVKTIRAMGLNAEQIEEICKELRDAR